MANRKYSTDNVLSSNEMRTERILLFIISILAPLCIGAAIIFFLLEESSYRIITGVISCVVAYSMYYLLFGGWYKIFSRNPGGGFRTIEPGFVGIILEKGTRTGWVVEEGLVLLFATEDIEIMDVTIRTLKVPDATFSCKNNTEIKFSFDLGVRASNPYKFVAAIKDLPTADEMIRNEILGVMATSLAEITAEEAKKRPDVIVEAVMKTLSDNDRFGIVGEAEVEGAFHWIHSFTIAGNVTFKNESNQAAADAKNIQQEVLAIAMLGKPADHIPTDDEINAARQFVLAQMGKATVSYLNVQGMEGGGTLIVGSDGSSPYVGGKPNKPKRQ